MRRVARPHPTHLPVALVAAALTAGQQQVPGRDDRHQCQRPQVQFRGRASFRPLAGAPIWSSNTLTVGMASYSAGSSLIAAVMLADANTLSSMVFAFCAEGLIYSPSDRMSQAVPAVHRRNSKTVFCADLRLLAEKGGQVPGMHHARQCNASRGGRQTETAQDRGCELNF